MELHFSQSISAILKSQTMQPNRFNSCWSQVDLEDHLGVKFYAIWFSRYSVGLCNFCPHQHLLLSFSSLLIWPINLVVWTLDWFLSYRPAIAIKWFHSEICGSSEFLCTYNCLFHCLGSNCLTCLHTAYLIRAYLHCLSNNLCF